MFRSGESALAILSGSLLPHGYGTRIRSSLHRLPRSVRDTPEIFARVRRFCLSKVLLCAAERFGRRFFRAVSSGNLYGIARLV
jgi:hypothetical protein